MAVNAVSICSNALLQLGDNPINSLTDSNDRARLCANLYPQIRDRMLRAHPWNCAIKRVVLAPDATAPAFDWQAQFLLPSDWLKTLQIGDKYQQLSYVSEGRYILANADALPLRYVFRNDVEGTWDSLLQDAMTLAMCVALAYPITESTTLRESFFQQLQAALKEARAVDGQDDPPDTFGDFPLLSSRF